MASLTDWDASYNRVNNAAQDIQSMISERDQQRRAGTMSTEPASRIRPALNTLERNMDKLDKDLRLFESSPPIGA